MQEFYASWFYLIFYVTSMYSFLRKKWNLNQNNPGVNKEQPSTKKALLK